jgi:LysR family glycine cleavage system transcriptional activator
MTLDASARGHGMALSHLLLAEDYLRAGTLIAPIEVEVDTGRKVFVAWPARSGKASLVERFSRWIKSEIGLVRSGGGRFPFAGGKSAWS